MVFHLLLEGEAEVPIGSLVEAVREVCEFRLLDVRSHVQPNVAVLSHCTCAHE